MTSTAAAPRVGMALIVRDEVDTIERCLASFVDHVDVVAVLDTGSVDGTRDVVARFMADHPGTAYVAGTFDWCDDFAAARTAAENLLIEAGCDWLGWIDADDELAGAHNLRPLVERAGPDVGALGFDYDYLRDAGGACVCRLKRERLVRAGAGRWTGRVHEAQLIDGRIEWVDPAIVEWIHRKAPEAVEASSERNRALLGAWLADEPDNPRVLAYLGTEYMAAGAVADAIPLFDRYLEQPNGWIQERCQVRRKLAVALIAGGRLDDAERQAYGSLSEDPAWPDAYMTLAEVAYHRGRFDVALTWARRVLELGVPSTLLIIDPTDYTGRPRLLEAGALGALGRVREAMQAADAGLAILPGHPELGRVRAGWAAQIKRDDVAESVIAAAQVLVGHDEQAKARLLLEACVPYFAVDHPAVVACRSQLRERMAWVDRPVDYAEHYVVGGSKPEDFYEDPVSMAIATNLPRAHFLAGGLAEQLEERA